MNLLVVKVGGSLARIPGALDRVCSELTRVAGKYPIVLVPGGGPFSDAVRQFEAGSPLSQDAAHWMAILGMDQYAHVLADRIPGALLIDQPGEIREAISAGHLPVLAPYRWMRSADLLPHSWEVTSDSIAAVIAGSLGAERLALIKPADSGDLVDPYFETALPVGLPYLILSWEQSDRLEPWLSGRSAGAVLPEWPARNASE